MPAELHWKEDHFIIAYSGFLQMNEVFYVYDQLAGSSRYDDAEFGVVDCREFEDSEYDSKAYDIHVAYAKVVASHLLNRPFKVAVIVSTEKAAKKVQKIIESSQKFLHVWDRRMFWDYDEGIKWASSSNKS